ncbi:hypothetical protein JCM10914_3542 [Paenibacillus sp. JCM 10914]|nr:hypothetical protein JCM10914_3542 [Paenibacillus sp. JCM 10914]
MILIPLYTHNLSQELYGQYDLIISVQQLLALAITLGVYSGMIRFFNEVEDPNQLKNTTMTFSMLWGGVCIVLALLLNPLLHPLMFRALPEAHFFIPCIVISSVFVCLNTIYSSHYAMKFNALGSSAVQFSAILFTLLYALFFFLVMDMGILGILLSQMLGNMTVFIFMFIKDLPKFKFKIVKKEIDMMLRYGFGLILGDASSWILTLSDRFLIKGYMNLSSVAVYSVGYKIGMLINPVFINPFASVFTPFKYKVYNEPDGAARIGKMFRMYNFIGWFCVLGLSLFADIAIKLVATAEYQAADYLVPIIAFSYFLSGAIIFYSLGLHIANKMKLYSSIIVFASLVNLGVNLILIPIMGIYGAAISTVIAYIAANGVFYYFGSKYYALGFGWLYPYKYLVIFCPLYAIYFVCHHLVGHVSIEILVNVVLCMAYIGMCIMFKFISMEEVRFVLSRVRWRKKNKMAVEGVHSET